MLSDDLSARVDAFVTDHHGMSAGNLAAAGNQFFDLMPIRTAEKPLCGAAFPKQTTSYLNFAAIAVPIRSSRAFAMS